MVGRPSSRADGSFRYVPALDGLRALAVAGVMADHGGISWMVGGYLGVDAFFVLSGFLITSLLVAEWGASGGIGLRAFWARRARRLLPALFLVIVAITIYAGVSGYGADHPALRLDAFSTLFYVANWHFILAGSNYFTASGPVSLLLHTWSLAVEEQFYLVWPLVTLGVLAWSTKRRKANEDPVRTLAPLLLVAAVLSVASAVEMALLYRPGSNATRVYFGTDTHAVGLLAGAALAVGLAMWRRRPAARATAPAVRGAPVGAARTLAGQLVLTTLGVVGVAVAAWGWTHWSGNDAFAYQGGIAVSALAIGAVVLCVAQNPGGVLAKVLSIPPLRYVGRISYELYLWHWPVFILLDSANAHLNGAALFAARCGVSLVLSVASYHLVEQPIRRGTLWREWRAHIGTPVTVGVVVSSILLATPVAAAPVNLSPAAVAIPAARSDLQSSQSGSTGATTASGSAPGSPVRVLLVGDSTALTLSLGLSGADHIYNVDLNARHTLLGCGVAQGNPLIVHGKVGPIPGACSLTPGVPQWPQIWEAAIATFHPQVVMLLAGRWEVMDRWHDGHWEHLGPPSRDPQYDGYILSQLQRAIRVMTSGGARAVLMTAPCYSSGEQANGAPWPEDGPGRVSEYNDLVRRAAAGDPTHASVFNLNALTCPGGHFTATMHGVDIRCPDGIHFTPDAGRFYAPAIDPFVVDLARAGPGRVRAPTIDTKVLGTLSPRVTSGSAACNYGSL